MDKDATKRRFERDLNRVSDAILAAQQHFEIYHIYKNEQDRPKYADVCNHYLGFFHASISAQFTAMLLCLSKVMDKNPRNGTSLYSLAQTAQTNGLVQAKTLAEATGLLNDAKELFGRIAILRNNHFAHLGKLDSAEAFNRAGLCRNDLRNAIELAKDVFNKISYAYNQSRHSFGLSPTRDTYRLLNDLVSLNSQRSSQ